MIPLSVLDLVPVREGGTIGEALAETALIAQTVEAARYMGEARAVGSPETIRAAMEAFIERTQADEIIVAGAPDDPVARHSSLQLTMDAMRL